MDVCPERGTAWLRSSAHPPINSTHSLIYTTAVHTATWVSRYTHSHTHATVLFNLLKLLFTALKAQGTSAAPPPQHLPSPWLSSRADLGRAWSPVAAEAKPVACARSLACAAASAAAVYLRFGRGFLHWWTCQLIWHATEDNHTAKRLPPPAV